jgi:hypothetical protein
MQVSCKLQRHHVFWVGHHLHNFPLPGQTEQNLQNLPDLLPKTAHHPHYADQSAFLVRSERKRFLVSNSILSILKRRKYKNKYVFRNLDELFYSVSLWSSAQKDINTLQNKYIFDIHVKAIYTVKHRSISLSHELIDRFIDYFTIPCH